MNLQQAMQVIKNALDAGIKVGVCPNVDTAAILAQAWQILTNAVNKPE